MARDFAQWLLTFTDSIANYKYYIDFETIYKNAEEHKIELNMMNSLIGSKTIENDFEKLVIKYPEVIKCIPTLLAVRQYEIIVLDDEGNKFELAPDPMNEELQEQFKDIVVGKPETFKDQLKPILSNERLFFTDLYKDGVGEKVEDMFREMIAGPGAVRATIHKYVG